MRLQSLPKRGCRTRGRLSRVSLLSDKNPIVFSQGNRHRYHSFCSDHTDLSSLCVWQTNGEKQAGGTSYRNSGHIRTDTKPTNTITPIWSEEETACPKSGTTESIRQLRVASGTNETWRYDEQTDRAYQETSSINYTETYGTKSLGRKRSYTRDLF
jgi:hypothetical protein